MNRNVSPLTTALIVAGILVVLGGFYLFRNSQSSQEVEQTAKRGEASGQKMMQALAGKRSSGP